MNLIRKITYTDEIPKGYGVFYYYPGEAAYQVAPIPFNLLLGFIYTVYYRVRAGIYPKWYYNKIDQAIINERARSLEQFRESVKNSYRRELWEEIMGHIKNNLNVIRVALDTKINTEDDLKEKFGINEERGK